MLQTWKEQKFDTEDQKGAEPDSRFHLYACTARQLFQSPSPTIFLTFLVCPICNLRTQLPCAQVSYYSKNR